MDNFSNAAKLKVVGVGGAGGNAINDMIESNITTVDFIAINTDQQDLDRSKASIKVLLGKGMGAGADPEKGRIAAKESEEKIKDVLEGNCRNGWWNWNRSFSNYCRSGKSNGNFNCSYCN